MEFHKSFLLVFLLSTPALLSLFVSFSLESALVSVVRHLSYLCFVHSLLHEVRTVRGSAVEVLVDQLWSFLLSPPVSHLFVCSFLFSPIVVVL
jgi:hypothetical protein